MQRRVQVVDPVHVGPHAVPAVHHHPGGGVVGGHLAGDRPPRPGASTTFPMASVRSGRGTRATVTPGDLARSWSIGAEPR